MPAKTYPSLIDHIDLKNRCDAALTLPHQAKPILRRHGNAYDDGDGDSDNNKDGIHGDDHASNADYGDCNGKKAEDANAEGDRSDANRSLKGNHYHYMGR